MLAPIHPQRSIAWRVFRDLSPFDAYTRHEALLAKEKGIDAFLEGRRGKGFAEALICYDKAWHAAELESIGFAKVI